MEPFDLYTAWVREAEEVHAERLRRDLITREDKIIDMLMCVADKDMSKIKIGAGWVPAAADLHHELVKYAPTYRIFEIVPSYEKGRMRYFVTFDKDADLEQYTGKMYSLMHDYENRTKALCELCGAPSENKTTRCGSHHGVRMG